MTRIFKTTALASALVLSSVFLVGCKDKAGNEVSLKQEVESLISSDSDKSKDDATSSTNDQQKPDSASPDMSQNSSSDTSSEQNS